MLWTYALKASEGKCNELNMDDDGIIPMEKSAGTTTSITLKIHRTWGCAVYILDERFQGGISGLPKWETRSRAGIYIGH